MNLNKTQVKSLLDVMSSDATRPVLTTAHINKVEDAIYLTATDGYYLVALKLSNDLEDVVGKSVSRAELIKWYKLADRKSVFNDETVRELATDSEGNYPNWFDLISKDEQKGPLQQLTINAKYMLTLQIINDAPLKWEFCEDKFKPVIARNNDNIYVVMPLKG